MAKDAKASRKRARAVGGPSAEELRKAERAALKRLRRLAAELDAAQRAEARRRKQLNAAEATLRDVLARVAGLAASVKEPASDVARDLLASTQERLGDLAESGTDTVRDAATSVAGAGRGIAHAVASSEARASSAAARSRRWSAVDPAIAAPGRPALAGAGVAGGTDTPRTATRRRRTRPLPTGAAGTEALTAGAGSEAAAPAGDGGSSEAIGGETSDAPTVADPGAMTTLDPSAAGADAAEPGGPAPETTVESSAAWRSLRPTGPADAVG